MQDRDKGVARIHLAETIEELKKFNARRKLKESVKAAVSSSKWHAGYSEVNGDSFFDIGDDKYTTTGMDDRLGTVEKSVRVGVRVESA